MANFIYIWSYLSNVCYIEGAGNFIRTLKIKSLADHGQNHGSMMGRNAL